MATTEQQFYQVTWISTICQHLSWIPSLGQGLTQRVGYDRAHCHSRALVLKEYGRWWGQGTHDDECGHHSKETRTVQKEAKEICLLHSSKTQSLPSYEETAKNAWAQRHRWVWEAR